MYTAGEAKVQLDPFLPVTPDAVRTGLAGCAVGAACREPTAAGCTAPTACALLPSPASLRCAVAQEARLRDIMEDLHDSFKARVRESRGVRLAADRDAELFSGRAWTGRQALGLGLVDGLGDMRSVMQEQFGDKARFLLCSEQPSPSIRDLFGLGSGGGSGGGGPLQRLAAAAGGAGQDTWYAATRGALEAALDEAEQRALWARFCATL